MISNLIKKYIKIICLLILLAPTNGFSDFSCGTAGGRVAFSDTKSVTNAEGASFFNPLAKLYWKRCGFGICGCPTETFKGYGECKFIQGVRFCARVTPANQYGNNSNNVKICIFEDSMDARDTTKDFMPYHNNQPTGQSNSYGSKTVDALVGIFTLGIANATKAAGSYWNNVVLKNHGCVDIPIAPFPPPYPKSMSPILPEANVQKICAQNESSTLIDNCVITSSSTNNIGASYNNFEHPLLRVGYDNYIPKCSSDSDTKACVKICNISSTRVNDTDLLDTCPGTICPNDNTKCIIFKNTDKFSRNKTRVIYQYTYNGLTNYTPWIDDDSNDIQLSVYGVNNADFYDMAFVPSNDQTPTLYGYGTSSPSYQTIYQPMISSDFYSKFYTYIDPNDFKNICIKKIKNNSISPSDTIVGCVSRAQMPKPVVAKCGGTPECYCPNEDNCSNCTTLQDTCVSDDQNPNIVIGFGNPIKEAILNASINLPANIQVDTNQSNIARLYGIPFSAVATNEDYSTPLTNNQIFGNYDQNNVYMNGVEYLNSNQILVYKRGATQICAVGYDSNQFTLSNVQNYNSSSFASSKISDRIYPNNYYYYSESGLVTNVNPICNRNIPQCNSGQKCCNPCKSWEPNDQNNIDINNYNGLDSDGNCLFGYVNAARIPIISDLTLTNSTNTSLCNNSDGTIRAPYNVSNSVQSSCNSCSNKKNGNNCSSNDIDISTFINSNTEMLRSTNPIEDNICVSLEMRNCPLVSENNADESNGYAIWPETPSWNKSTSPSVSDKAIGKCIDGYKSDSNPKRSCYDGTWDSNIVDPCKIIKKCGYIEYNGAEWAGSAADHTQEGSCASAYQGDIITPTMYCDSSGNWDLSSIKNNTCPNP